MLATTLTLRLAILQDVPSMHQLRMAVRENRLRDPSRVTPAHYGRYIADSGACWVAEHEDRVVGFGIADRRSRSIWALFVQPEFEGRGIGRLLLQRLTDWLFSQGSEPINLSTDPGTRAERLYRAAGWRKVGQLATGELWLERTDASGS